MPYVLLIIVFLIAIGSAYFIVGRESKKQATTTEEVVFDVDDAVAWIADHLSEEHQAILSFSDVRSIIVWNIEFMKSRGAIANGHSPHVVGPVVVNGAECVEYIATKPEATARELTAAQIYDVLETQVRYFEHIGAVGQPAESTEDTQAE